jgi:hypothetical protein
MLERMNDMAEPNGRGPESVPMVLGVTGHRDLVLEDIPLLEQMTGAFFDELKQRFPHTPMVLISPLAEGADRLAARVALKHGARLIVPMPMERELYEQDFAAPESRREFGELLACADPWYELPILPGATREQIERPGPERDLQYESVGFHVSRESQILIALMEEASSPAAQVHVGGTAQIVLSRLGKLTEALAHEFSMPLALEKETATERHPWMEPVLCLEDAGPVYHIPVRRRRSASEKGDYNPKAAWLYPEADRGQSEEDLQSHFSSAWECLDAYNADVLALRDADRSRMTVSEEYLLSGDRTHLLTPELRRIRRTYAAADMLATSMQATSKRTIQGLFLMAYAAFTVFTIYSYSFWDSPYLLLTYPALIGIAYLCYPTDRFQEWFWFIYRHCGWLSAYNKYLDYRALAEGLRVQFYWRLAGMPDGAASQYLHKQKAEIDWIRQALNSIHLLTGAPPKSASLPDEAERLAAVRSLWVQSQAEWFARKASQQGPKLDVATARAKILIVVGILSAAALGLVLFLIPDFNEWNIPGTAICLVDAIHAFLELAALAGAFWLAYLEKLFCEEQVKRYEQMSRLFGRADHHLVLYLNRWWHQRACNVLRELGNEAIDESADWLMMHRQNPPELEN